MNLTVATEDDVGPLASLHAATAEALTACYGRGHWSNFASERGVASQMRFGRVLVLRDAGRIVATLRLSMRKPWAIDVSYFTAASRPLYLTDMAVAPDRQREGFGRAALADAARVAAEWPADAIRLDAYDADAGAGPFYARCGFSEVGRVVYRGTPLIYFEQVIAPERSAR